MSKVELVVIGASAGALEGLAAIVAQLARVPARAHGVRKARTRRRD